jgi:mRNA-degrading endonuclease YafQ of YafQ-DinJ toxin-antitoxin module
MIKVVLTGNFESMLQELNASDPYSFDLTQLQIKRFKRIPKDSRLANHALKRWMKDKWAFNVDDDIRIVYEWLGKTTVRFLAIGPHHKVYKKEKAR